MCADPWHSSFNYAIKQHRVSHFGKDRVRGGSQFFSLSGTREIGKMDRYHKKEKQMNIEKKTSCLCLEISKKFIFSKFTYFNFFNTSFMFLSTFIRKCLLLNIVLIKTWMTRLWHSSPQRQKQTVQPDVVFYYIIVFVLLTFLKHIFFTTS